MKNIQDMINLGGSVVELPSGEYKGTIIVNRPCTVNGNSTTLWNNDGAVLEIRSPGVKISNLRAEVTNHNSDILCINSYSPDTIFENVEIAGSVRGIKDEELQWIVPKSLYLGEFKSNAVNTYFIEIYVPVSSEIYSNIEGINISPNKLEKGKNIVSIQTDSIKDSVFIYGEIFIKSKFLRRIYISGKCFSYANLIQNKCLYIAESPSPEKNIERNFNNISIKPQSIIINPVQENESDNSIKKLHKGERIYIDNIADNLIQVEFNCRQMLSEMDIDPYVFLLNKDGIVDNDNNFVFFSNPVSAGGEVRIQKSDKSKFDIVEVELSKIPQYIQKVSLAYSIYVNSSRDNFSKVKDPFVTIRSNGEIKYLFPAENLIMETTVIFLEFYQHNMSWKMNMVGAGYKRGLSALCESYGLSVGY